MRIVLFGPLGWKKNIWNIFMNQLDQQTSEVHTYTFFEFPQSDIHPEEYEVQIFNLLRSTSFDCIIASSYGVNFFLYLIGKYQLSFFNTKIILIDGILDVEGKMLIQNIQNTRKEYFTSFEVFRREILGEIYSDFEVDIIQSIYDFNRNRLIFTNSDLFLWIQYGESFFIRNNIKKIKNQMKDTIVFSQNYDWVDTLDVREFIQIEESEHLLMLENPKKIIEVIWRP